MRDNYEKMKKMFAYEDKRDAIKSGVGGEVLEEHEFLSIMREA